MTVPCLQQDFLGMQKAKTLQGSMQVSAVKKAGQESTMQWQVNPWYQAEWCGQASKNN